MTTTTAGRGDRQITYTLHAGGDIPAVMIAGTGMSGAFWEVAQTPAMSQDLTALVVDNAGTGGTDFLPDGSWTSEEMAQDALAVLDAIGWQGAHFIGQSLGSVIVQAAAHLAPDRVYSMSLHSTWRCTRDAAFLEAWFEARQATARARNSELWARYAFFLVSPHYLQSQGLAGGAVGQVVKRVGDVPPEAHLGHYKADLSHDSSAYLSTLEIPTLVTVGEDDFVTLPMFGGEVAELIRGAEFHLFPQAGHLACLEVPDQFNSVQLRFLREVERSRTSSQDAVKPTPSTREWKE